MTMYVPFPKMLYHASEAPCIVQNQTELDALGHDWHDTPDRAMWPGTSPARKAMPEKPVAPVNDDDRPRIVLPGNFMPASPPQDYGHDALPETAIPDIFMPPSLPSHSGGGESKKPEGDKK